MPTGHVANPSGTLFTLREALALDPSGAPRTARQLDAEVRRGGLGLDRDAGMGREARGDSLSHCSVAADYHCLIRDDYAVLSHSRGEPIASGERCFDGILHQWFKQILIRL